MRSNRMSDREDLIRAYQAGQLLDAIEAALSTDPRKREALAADLADLHNDGTIDVVAAFA